MGGAYTIDQLADLYREIRVAEIGCNIIFPSHDSNRVFPNGLRSQEDEAIDVAVMGLGFARKLGLLDEGGHFEGRDFEFRPMHYTGVGECFMKFKTLERFIEAIEIFRQNNQLPPYSMLCYFKDTGIVIQFGVQDKNTPEYTYVCLNDELVAARKKE